MTTDRITDAAAAAGLASPIWLPALRDASEIAGLLLPIVGLIWLVLRVARWLIRRDED